MSFLPPIKDIRGVRPPIENRDGDRDGDRDPPKDRREKLTEEAIKNFDNILNLSNDIGDERVTKLKLLKKYITNINYNLLYFLSHDINFSVNSENLLSLFVSKNKIILHNIYNFINITYRDKFKIFLLYITTELSNINILYENFKLNARNRILGMRYFEITNAIKEKETLMRAYINKCIIDLKKIDDISITSIESFFNTKNRYFNINYINNIFEISYDYDTDKHFSDNIERYSGADNLKIKNTDDNRIIKIDNFIFAIEELNKFKKFYDFIYKNADGNDEVKIIKFNEDDYDNVYKHLIQNFNDIIEKIKLKIKGINEFFDTNINKIISNKFKYEDNYKIKFDIFITNIKKIYKVEIKIDEINASKTLDFSDFLSIYNSTYMEDFNYPFLNKRIETFNYMIPTFSIESEFYKENKVIEVNTYNISIPYNQKIINYNVEYIRHYQFLLKNIFYKNSTIKNYSSFYTKHQILWALIQNTFLIFNEIINILLDRLSKIDSNYINDFKVEYKLGIENATINEIFIDIKNINIVFNNLIFIFIIPRLMLISKIYNHPGNNLNDFEEINPIKLYYLEDYLEDYF